jgi:uncharacterized membrane protein YphA (DoxX/SURF4 family)
MQTLTLFPGLLDYSFYAPTILRVAAALVIASLALAHWQKRDELHKLLRPLTGSSARFLVPLAVLVEAATAMLLFIGLYTQAAAIVGMFLALRSLILRPRALAPYGHAADWLLLSICASLLLTGAGAIAFDLPL